MAPKKTTAPLIPAFMVIVFTGICIQAVGRYNASSTLVIGSHFYTLWILVRIFVPIALFLMLRIPFSTFGLGRPQIDKKLGKTLAVIFILLILAFVSIYFFQDYFNYYSKSFRSTDGQKISRLLNFMIFTSSTLTAWEFFHRGFLLRGLTAVLAEREHISLEKSQMIAVCIVWVFEVIYHFIKPGIEAVGLLVGSPILSYLAIRTKSIWIPFLIHLFVEILFISILLLR